MMIKEDKVEIEITTIENSRLPQIDFNNLKFGREFSDHIFYIDYEDGQWLTPKIIPYQSMSFSPAASVLHYGQAIFEGMKAYKNADGSIYLFRPEKNIARFNESAERMCMPTIDPEQFEEGLITLLKLDSGWIPDEDGFSLYIRPFMFAMDQYIGVKPSQTYRMMIFTCPVGKYYSGAIKVKVEKHFTRAVEGGTGFAKCAGNYAMSLYPAKLAQEQGYDQLIWTDAIEHKWIEESGTMNIMFRTGNTLLTPPTGDTILAGITRDSVITLARDWGYVVEERPVSVEEIRDLMDQGKLDEAFGIGTAATIAPFSLIGFEDRDRELSDFSGWEFANRVLTTMTQIKKGDVVDKHNWNMKIV